MLRATAYVVAVLVLIALGIAVKQGWFGEAENMQQETALRVIAPALGGTITESVMSSSTQLHESNNAASVQSSSALMHSAGPELPNQVIVQHDHGGGSQSSTSTDTEADPAELIGRPFPMSASVAALCKSYGTGVPCDDEVFQLLSVMAQEPRDPAWAPNTEAKLRTLVLAETNPFTIRAIECRTSLCAVEVASIFGPYFGHLDADKSLDRTLMRWDAVRGYERDLSSTRITVSLMIFKRR